MLLIVLGLGIFMLAAGVVLMISPGSFRRALARLVNPAGIYGAAAVRLALGICLALAAPQSRYPMFLYVLSGIVLITAAMPFLIGLERAKRFLTWWVARPDGFLRVWAVVAGVIGFALIRAVP